MSTWRLLFHFFPPNQAFGRNEGRRERHSRHHVRRHRTHPLLSEPYSRMPSDGMELLPASCSYDHRGEGWGLLLELAQDHEHVDGAQVRSPRAFPCRKHRR